jgi:hypothetical protein
MLEISRTAAQLATSEEGLSSMKLVSILSWCTDESVAPCDPTFNYFKPGVNLHNIYKFNSYLTDHAATTSRRSGKGSVPVSES